MIRRWHVCISGFRQDLGHECGIEVLWRELRRLSSPGESIQIKQWRDDWAAFAEFLVRNSASGGGAAEVNVYAYSWGGDAAIELCEALKKLTHARDPRGGMGVSVGHLVLCDAVYRSSWLPEAIPVNPWSLLPWAKIRVPANVREVRWFYQRVDWPRGHEVVARDPRKTRLHPGVELGVGHGAMDEAEAFHRAVLRAAGVPF